MTNINPVNDVRLTKFLVCHQSLSVGVRVQDYKSLRNVRRLWFVLPSLTHTSLFTEIGST